MNQNAYKLLGILQDHAPDTSAQNDCTRAYNDVEKHDPDHLELAMAMALVDGLAYGNWPWTVKP